MFFAYFCKGHDDNSKNSQSALESRYLTKDAKGLSPKIYGSFPGADQLALLLIARYHNDANHLKPTFSVIYPLGREEDTVPSYENQPIGKTIEEHVIAAGGTIIKRTHRILCLPLIRLLFRLENPEHSATTA